MKIFSSFLVFLSSFFTAYTQSWNNAKRIPEYFGEGGTLYTASSFKTVNHKPAMVFYDDTRKKIMYMQSADTLGTTWNEPVIIEEYLYSYSNLSFELINGIPAVCYGNPGNIKYVHALDENGMAWSSPITITTGETGSLAEINGYPCISYTKSIGSDLQVFYIRANDSIGNTWGSPVNVYGMNDAYAQTRLKNINGHPAICFGLYDLNDFYYVRAADSIGSSWGSPSLITNYYNSGNFFLEVVNGFPAITYMQGSYLQYCRALDSTGTTWGTSIDFGYNKYPTGLKTLNGKPAIMYIVKSAWEDKLYYMDAADIDGTTWNSTIYISDIGEYTMVSPFDEVSQHPAFCYTENCLIYNRSNDSLGDTWTQQDTFCTTGKQMSTISLRFFENVPSVLYQNLEDSSELIYTRAINASGTQWKSPQVLASYPEVYGLNRFDLCNVLGLPGIVYVDFNKRLKYIRGNDLDGLSFQPPIILDTLVETGTDLHIEIINGHPAVCYMSYSGNLKYLRALDSLGTTWSPPIIVCTGVGTYCSMREISGKPAIAFNRINQVRYIRALDTDGNTWPGSPVTLDPTLTIYFPSLHMVNGNPTVSYVTNTGIKYVRANDSNGTTWGSPITILSGSSIKPSELEVVDGYPQVVYYNTTLNQLNILKAINANGTAWNSPVTLSPIDESTQHPGLYDHPISFVSDSGQTGIAFNTAPYGYPFYLGTCIAPIIPTNTTDTNDLSICIGQNTTLSALGNGILSWYDAPTGGNLLNVGNSYFTQPLNSNISFYVQDSVCEIDSMRLEIQVSVSPLPSVSLDLSSIDTLCTNSSAVLTGGLPLGGTYYGDGISAGVFDASAVGIGNANIYYTYTDLAGCADTASGLIFVDICLGYGPVDNTHLSLYPNPSSDLIFIDSDAIITDLIIYSISGDKIKQLAVNNTHARLSIAELPAGIYFIECKTSIGQQRIKAQKL